MQGAQVLGCSGAEVQRVIMPRVDTYTPPGTPKPGIRLTMNLTAVTRE